MPTNTDARTPEDVEARRLRNVEFTVDLTPTFMILSEMLEEASQFGLPTEEGTVSRNIFAVVAHAIATATRPTWENTRITLDDVDRDTYGMQRLPASNVEEYTFSPDFTVSAGSLSFPVIEGPRPEETFIRRSRYELLLDDSWDPVTEGVNT
jgi:hypothetical protein